MSGEKVELISDVKAELELLDQQNIASTQPSSASQSQNTKPPKGENLLLSLVSDIVQSDTNNTLPEASQATVSEKIDLEIVRYCSEPPAELHYKNASTLLNWWKQNCLRYPFLAQLV